MTDGERSGVYVGHVVHQRLRPRRHSLRHKVFWLFVDLDELKTLSDRLWFFSYNGRNLLSLFDGDHGDGSDTPLRDQIHVAP